MTLRLWLKSIWRRLTAFSRPKGKRLIFPDSLRMAPEIYNIIDTLPWHPTRRWDRRRNRVRHIVVHQTLGEGTLKGVNNYHITPSTEAVKNHISDRGCPHICYHYVVDPGGKLFQVNATDDITWHVRGRNSSSIGILVMGNFEGSDWKPKGPRTKPSKAQLYGLHNLLSYLKSIPKFAESHIVGHSQLDLHKVNCPGLVLNGYVKNFISETSSFKEAERFLRDYAT